MFTSLMTARRFAPLFWCQFFSALNDNFLKQGLVILIHSLTLAEGQSGVLVALAGAVFIAPFFLLSAPRRRTRRQVRQGAGLRSG